MQALGNLQGILVTKLLIKCEDSKPFSSSNNSSVTSKNRRRTVPSRFSKNSNASIEQILTQDPVIKEGEVLEQESMEMINFQPRKLPCHLSLSRNNDVKNAAEINGKKVTNEDYSL